MRTLVDLPQEDLRLLKAISEEQRVSRAEVVRRAVSAYLEPRRRSGPHRAFGLWAKRAEDGLSYQNRLRDEWPD